jgi:hypothetical protein
LITVAVLVCLVVITMIGAGLLRLVGSQRATIRGEESGLQSEWLAESGVEHAVARLDGDPAYQGETWSIPAEALGGPAPGVVSIKVGPIDDDPDRRLVTVQADYPSDPGQRIRTSKRTVVQLGPGGAGAKP